MVPLAWLSLVYKVTWFRNAEIEHHESLKDFMNRPGPESILDLRGDWFVDLSLAEVHRDLESLVESGGAGHILFGSHVPFSYTASALVKLVTLPVDDETRAAISGAKAQELYGS